MNVSIRVAVATIGIFGVALTGCQSEDVAPVESNRSVAPSEQLAAPTARPEPDKPAPGEAESTAPVVAASADFAPPFPDRVDFFVPPRRARTAQRGDEVVELRGFITPPDNQGTRVLLAINGTESPIAAGQEKMGVKVISIEQPKVVLQRGRNRWTETLE